MFRSGTGPISLQLDVNANNAGFAPVDSPQSVPEETLSLITFDLTSLTGITSAVFRIQGFTASNQGSNSTLAIAEAGTDFLYSGSLDLDLAVQGVAAIPEPGAAMFGGLVCGEVALAAASRRIIGKPAPSTVA